MIGFDTAVLFKKVFSADDELKRHRTMMVELAYAIQKMSTNEAQRYHLLTFWDLLSDVKGERK